MLPSLALSQETLSEKPTSPAKESTPSIFQFPLESPDLKKTYHQKVNYGRKHSKLSKARKQDLQHSTKAIVRNTLSLIRPDPEEIIELTFGKKGGELLNKEY